jgi:hypothetical protein
MGDSSNHALAEQLCVVFHSVSAIPCLTRGMHDVKDPRRCDCIVNVEWQHDEVCETQIGNSLPNSIFADDDGRQMHRYSRCNERLEVLLCDAMVGTAWAAQADKKTCVEQY